MEERKLVKEAAMLNSPFKWVGGKSRLRRQIIPHIPPHTCYVEPFSGAAWVLFGKPPSDIEVLNDIDQELITFFRVVKEQPQNLIDSFEWDLVSRSEFNRLAQADPKTLSPLQRAHRFYYIIMAGWGGEFNYPRFQTSISDGGHGNRLAGALKTLRERIEPIHKRLSTVIIENLDWQACIDKYDGDQTFFYLDPPYPGNGANYAHNMRNWDDHHALAERLSNCRAKWLLSSYNIPEVRQLFNNYVVIPIQSASGMATTKGGNKRVPNLEIVVANYQPATLDSIQPSQAGMLQLPFDA